MATVEIDSNRWVEIAVRGTYCPPEPGYTTGGSWCELGRVVGGVLYLVRAEGVSYPLTDLIPRWAEDIWVDLSRDLPRLVGEPLYNAGWGVSGLVLGEERLGYGVPMGKTTMVEPSDPHTNGA